MCVYPEGGGSAQDASVSLVSVDVVSGLGSVARCGPIPWFEEVGSRW
jgi:hypothetical protein